MDLRQFSLLCAALGNPNRARIVEYLSCGPLCACELLEHFHISQPTLSSHMRILREAGLVTERQAGRWKHYSLNRELLAEFLAFAACLFRGDESCVCRQRL